MRPVKEGGQLRPVEGVDVLQLQKTMEKKGMKEPPPHGTGSPFSARIRIDLWLNPPKPLLRRA